jgi:ABC-2 type transport system ATP-binding protein
VGEHVPPGVELVEPSLEDAYLLLRGARDDDTDRTRETEVAS